MVELVAARVSSAAPACPPRPTTRPTTMDGLAYGADPQPTTPGKWRPALLPSLVVPSDLGPPGRPQESKTDTVFTGSAQETPKPRARAAAARPRRTRAISVSTLQQPNLVKVYAPYPLRTSYSLGSDTFASLFLLLISLSVTICDFVCGSTTRWDRKEQL